MAKEPIQYGPTVVVSLDGARALELTRYEGSEKVRDRNARGFYFAVRGDSTAAPSRLRAIFDGLAMILLKPELFGLPAISDQELSFVHFSEAAIGDRLDEAARLVLPTDGSAATIECFSACLDEWKGRTPADEDTVEAYIKARLFWSWRFGHDEASFTSPDFLRLGVSMQRFLQVAGLGEGTLWSFSLRNRYVIVLKATPQLLNAERDRRKGSAKQPRPQPTSPVFVDESRLQELRSIGRASHDLRRLIALCEELNICSANNCLHAMAMLTRAIIDHVPPVFGATSFNEVASNYPGTRSFKESMEHLSKSARKIGDSHLHVQVRSKEVLPTRTQVDFSRDLDVLLGEIVRILS